MGLFDKVEAPFKCAYCDHTEDLIEWQTKALHCTYHTYKVGDRVETPKIRVEKGYVAIVVGCPNCRQSVNAWICVEDGRFTDRVEPEKEEE